MRFTADVQILLLDDIETKVRVDFELIFDGDIPDYVIESCAITKLDEFDVEIEMNRHLLDKHTDQFFSQAFDRWFDENIGELLQAESDYKADMAYDRWREEHEFD